MSKLKETRFAGGCSGVYIKWIGSGDKQGYATLAHPLRDGGSVFRVTMAQMFAEWWLRYNAIYTKLLFEVTEYGALT
jgi:hypothetical protein